VFVKGFPGAAIPANCFVLAPADGEECVVVDPGIGVLDRLAEVLREHRLRPAAVLLTHGHVDHVYSVTPVCGGHGVAAHVHADDRYRLHDPYANLDPALVAMLEQEFGRRDSWVEPEDVVTVAHGDRLDVAGLTLDVAHVPGHTEGCLMFTLPGIPDDPRSADPYGAADGVADATATVLTGDVLFAGSIGRTDLPGSDPALMRRSLRERVLTLPDDTLVLPGHGPTTTIGRERVRNPFLVELVGEDGGAPGEGE